MGDAANKCCLLLDDLVRVFFPSTLLHNRSSPMEGRNKASLLGIWFSLNASLDFCMGCYSGLENFVGIHELSFITI